MPLMIKLNRNIMKVDLCLDNGHFITDFFKVYAMPLFNDLTSEKDYLLLYESKDKRIIWDDNQYLYIVATYLNNLDLNKAKLVIKNRFGKKGTRNKYKEVFEYFENAEE